MSVEASPDSPAAAPNGSFGPLRQIDAGVLNVGYVDAGATDAPAALLLHGWPYDIHSYADVTPLLTARGYRLLVPYLRGFGTTRFLSEETFRDGEPAALAVDVITLLDALKIDRAIVGGFDWGARTADIVAALWPERCRGLVSVSGYLIGGQEAKQDAVAAEGRAGMVVPVLFCHSTRSRRLREIPAGVCEAHLADRFSAVAFR